MERTGLVVVDDTCADDLAARREDLFKFQLSQGAGQTADVQVGVLDAFAARTRERHLQCTCTGRASDRSQIWARVNPPVGLVRWVTITNGGSGRVVTVSGTISHTRTRSFQRTIRNQRDNDVSRYLVLFTGTRTG